MTLQSKEDIDIQVYDTDYNDVYPMGQALVAWCNQTHDPECNIGVLGNDPGVNSVVYTRPNGTDDVAINVVYSGYNGVEGVPGKEWIEIIGTTPVDLKMAVFAYAPGLAEVSYSWERKQTACCFGKEACIGDSFERLMIEDEIAIVGEIPIGKRNIRINLTSAFDVDIQIYVKDLEADKYSYGKAIIGWCDLNDPKCNIGTLNGDGLNETMYDGVTYRYSGYNGYSGAGYEFVEIEGTTNHALTMAAFGYRGGYAKVEYSFYELDSATGASVGTRGGRSGKTSGRAGNKGRSQGVRERLKSGARARRRRGVRDAVVADGGGVRGNGRR